MKDRFENIKNQDRFYKLSYLYSIYNLRLLLFPYYDNLNEWIEERSQEIVKLYNSLEL